VVEIPFLNFLTSLDTAENVSYSCRNIPGRMGVQKPGFLPNLPAATRLFVKKPGFFGKSASRIQKTYRFATLTINNTLVQWKQGKSYELSR
jgi:hypothetical protein